MTAKPIDIYLNPGKFIDSDASAIIDFAKRIVGGISAKTAQAMVLYYAIRDGWRYDPYRIDLRPEAMKASALLTRDHGYCIEKANLLAAAARSLGIPARLGFANVKNHIGTEKLEKLLKTNLMVFHGFTELFIDGKWVKATPAFNKKLCKKLGVKPLEFNGRDDSIFQQYAADGSRFMEYVHDYGHFADVPRDLFIQELHKYYPHVFEKNANGGHLSIVI